jgi:hypothetical protein
LFASLVLLTAAAKKEKKKPWKPGASSGNITNLKQSIFCLSVSMVNLHVACIIKMRQNAKNQIPLSSPLFNLDRLAQERRERYTNELELKRPSLFGHKCQRKKS